MPKFKAQIHPVKSPKGSSPEAEFNRVNVKLKGLNRNVLALKIRIWPARHRSRSGEADGFDIWVLTFEIRRSFDFFFIDTLSFFHQRKAHLFSLL
jgi:hypothetical protein